MKQYPQMTTEERVQYNTSFTVWYANRDQITLCIQQTGGMDQAARSAFDVGTQFVMAWPFGSGFADSLNCLPAVRCVPRLMQLTDMIRKKISTDATAPQHPIIDPRQPAVAQPKPIETHCKPTAPSQGPAALTPSQGPATVLTPSQGAAALTPLPIANLHIDQILCLLSPKVRQRAESLKAKLDDRDINSNEAKRLAIEGKSEQEIAPYAKAASDAQQFVTDTYALIDDELAEYVATELYMRTHRPEGEAMEHAFKACLSNMEECAKPFGSLDRLCAALAPYYKKANENGRIDRLVEQDFATYSANANAEAATPSQAQRPNTLTPSQPEAPTYDPAEYKRIWTYANRKDVAHTDKRLKKMRQEIDKAIAAGMPNIEAMETIYAHEAELVLAEQQKKLNDQEPSLL